tara:strand:+ start:5477 stop:6361 length:885 start_codon:yes stop_codon:yes gene_type:complete
MNIRRRPPNPSIKVASLEYAIPHSNSEPQNILEKIIWNKNKEIELARNRVPLKKLKSQISSLPNTRPFLECLKNTPVKPAIIAEIKKASPSKGVIREDFDPVAIAKAYEDGGATCLSVLTEKTFFQGGFEILVEVRKKVSLPLLCKDFIFTPYQIFQARAAGADAVLFIASILTDQDLIYLRKIATSLSLTILVEVHDSYELERILKLDNFPLIGINNRDLKTFNIDLATTEMLGKNYGKQLAENNIVLVSESGLFVRSDLERVSLAGAQAVLVGESLMRQNDIKQGLRKLIYG